MASQRDPIQPPDHVAIFPPAMHQACKLESWSQTPINAAGPVGIIEGHIDRYSVIEDQDPERWDGMS